MFHAPDQLANQIMHEVGEGRFWKSSGLPRWRTMLSQSQGFMRSVTLNLSVQLIQQDAGQLIESIFSSTRLNCNNPPEQNIRVLTDCCINHGEIAVQALIYATSG